jgi:hypothetical protein
MACLCGTKSLACCSGPIPAAPSSVPAKLVSDGDDLGGPSNAGCCCFDQSKDCNPDGTWGPCY